MSPRFLSCFLFLLLSCFNAAGADLICPGKHWKHASPAEAGMDEAGLRAFVKSVGGSGCVVRNGRMVVEWGDSTANRDWASVAKPVLGTMLLLAVQNKKLKRTDLPVAQAGWPLEGKDSSITWRHLVDMTSGYARGEAPGAAWAYNDTAVQLLARSLEKVYGTSLETAAQRYLKPLRFEDGKVFGSRGGLGVVLSPRDMARLGWLWLNEGRWEDGKLMTEKLFAAHVRPDVPANLPQSKTEGHDYLNVGTYGGGTSQTTNGPGIYGFNLWFNEKLPSGKRVWPAAPYDTYQANGMWNLHTVTVFPRLKMVAVIWGNEKRGRFKPGSISGRSNQQMKLLMDAVVTGRPKDW